MGSPSLSQTSLKPAIPRMTDDQIHDFLHSSYTFKDVSFISRNVFRPFWKLMSSSYPTNLAPMFLLLIGVLLNLFNVLLLSWWDPDFNPSVSSRWIYLICAVCHIGAFTCTGIDAAGRFHRREACHGAKGNPVLNPYSSVEYIDRAFESLSLCMKAICFLHIIGVGRENLTYFSAYLLVAVILGCFLCQQWEANITTVYQTSVFLDSIEVALSIGFILKVLYGRGISWAALHKVYFMNIPLTLAFSGLFLTGAAISVLRCFARTGKAVSVGSSSKSTLLTFLALLVAQFSWTLSPGTQGASSPTGRVFPYLCWSTAVVCSSLVTDLILRQISKTDGRRSWSIAIPVLGMMAVWNIAGMFSSVSAIHTAWITICAILTIWHTALAVRAAKDVVYRLFLAVIEALFRRLGNALAPYWNKLKADPGGRRY